MDSIPPSLLQYVSVHRVAIERELGKRSLYDFFKMAWTQIDPAPFIDNWHIKLLCEELQAAACRLNRNLVINIPPRHGKSALISVAFIAWVWTWWPSAKFITASYALSLATRDALGTRRLVQSSWYQERWGETTKIAADQDQKTFYQTTAGGHRFVSTPTAALTGYGADFIIGDDLHNVAQGESEADRLSVRTYWFEAIPSRLDRPDDGVKIVIQQRVHETDISGECIKRGYHKVVLPAIADLQHPDLHPLDQRDDGEPLWPSRMSLATVKSLASEMGTYAASGQLQQRPVPREGGMFQAHWFQIEDACPSECFHNSVRRWDLAAAVPDKPGKDPDWTVGIRMGRDKQGNFWIMDMVRFRETPNKIETAMKAIASRDGTSCRLGIPQDPGQAGLAQVQYLTRQLAPYTVKAEKEGSKDVPGSKITRAEPFAAQVEARNVYLVKGAWNEAFLTEITSFPNASHDDVVDAATGAFRMLTSSGSGMLEYMRRVAGEKEVEVIPSTETTERVVLSR